MGVQTLWEILSPNGDCDVPVGSLAGKTIAVDLSAWIVEFKTSSGASQFHNVYIRNLFYRTIELMREGIKLVFVIDGRAPDMKHAAMLSRQQQQHGSLSSSVNPDRPMLNKAVAQCTKLLECLGIPYIQSSGEAEATCAYLNINGLVDGVLTEDSDFFCYGGRTLYRKLRKEKKRYVVDRYEADRISSEIGLDQHDLISLALLLGCDYNQKGVKSVGKEKGMKLVKELKSRGINVLDRLLGWHDNKELDSVEAQMKTKHVHDDHCSKCKHLGRINVHRESGCSTCVTKIECLESCAILCGCDRCKQQKLIADYKLEIKMRSRSFEDKTFPNKKLVEEYQGVNSNTSLGSVNVKQRPLDVPALVTYLQSKLHWDRTNVLDKVVPMVILSQLRTNEQDEDAMFTPIRIIKHCKDNHVDCYKVSWDKTDKNDWAKGTHATSVEVKVEKDLFTSQYPEKVKMYEDARAPKIKSAGKSRKSTPGKGQTLMTKFTTVKKKLEFSTDEKCHMSKSLGSKNNSASFKKGQDVKGCDVKGRDVQASCVVIDDSDSSSDEKLGTGIAIGSKNKKVIKGDLNKLRNVVEITSIKSSNAPDGECTKTSARKRVKLSSRNSDDISHEDLIVDEKLTDKVSTKSSPTKRAKFSTKLPNAFEILNGNKESMNDSSTNHKKVNS